MDKITEKDLIEMGESLMELIWMPNKADANPLASRIRHRAHNFSYEDFKDRELLFVAIGHAEAAAGDARRKEYWIREYEPVWNHFESSIMNKLASKFIDQGVR
jgi:hypothetical protein